MVALPSQAWYNLPEKEKQKGLGMHGGVRLQAQSA
jgi:hypothetical protein